LNVLNNFFIGVSDRELLGSNIEMQMAVKNPLELLAHQLEYIDSKQTNTYGKIVKQFVGGKWKPYGFSDPKHVKALDWAVSSLRAVVIYSHRNPVDVFFSNAIHNGSISHAHCKTLKKCAIAEARVQVDTDHMLKVLEDSDSRVAFLEEAFNVTGASPIRMHYEDWATGPERSREANMQRVVNQVADALGVPRPTVRYDKLRLQTVVTTPARREDRVINYADVVAALEKTKFRKWL